MIWDGRRVPFTLLGGYLGAGKTTILNRAIHDAGDRRLVVLVNDLGTINVDAALVADHDGPTWSLTNGCVCCAIADDFGQTLETVRSLPTAPDQVLMELSGVAEPGRVVPWANTAGFRLDGVLVAVDADQIGDQVERTDVGDTVRAQLDAADLIVLTKTDLVDDGGEAAAAVVAAHTSAPIRHAAALPPSLLLGANRASELSRSSPLGDAGRYVTDTVRFDGGTRSDLERLLDLLPAGALRVKGIVRCDGELVEVHVVGRRRDVRPRPDLRADSSTGVLVTIGLAPV